MQRAGLAVFFIIITIIAGFLVAKQVPISVAEAYAPWATWLATIAALASAGTATIAAILLSRALSESQKATKLMRKQLKLQLHQGKAFMTLDAIKISHVHDGNGNITGVKFNLDWKNTGRSPAFNVKSGGLSGFAIVDSTTAPDDMVVDLEYQNSSVVAAGGLQLGETVFQIADIVTALADGESGVLYSLCVYDDLYGTRYQSEYCGYVEWPSSIANPNLALESIKSGIKVRPWGQRNRITKVPRQY